MFVYNVYTHFAGGLMIWYTFNRAVSVYFCPVGPLLSVDRLAGWLVGRPAGQWGIESTTIRLTVFRVVVGNSSRKVLNGL